MLRRPRVAPERVQGHPIDPRRPEGRPERLLPACDAEVAGLIVRARAQL